MQTRVFHWNFVVFVLVALGSFTVEADTTVKWSETPVAAITGLKWKGTEFRVEGRAAILEGSFIPKGRTLVWNNIVILPMDDHDQQAHGFTFRVPLKGNQTWVELDAVDLYGGVMRTVLLLDGVAGKSAEATTKPPRKNFWGLRLYAMSGVANGGEWIPDLTYSPFHWAILRVGTDLDFLRGHLNDRTGWGLHAGAHGSYLSTNSTFNYPLHYAFSLDAQRGRKSGATWSMGLSFEKTSVATPDRADASFNPISQAFQNFQARTVYVLWLNVGFETRALSGLWGLEWRAAPRISKSLVARSSSEDGASIFSQNSILLGWRAGAVFTVGLPASGLRVRAQAEGAYLGGDSRILETEGYAGLQYEVGRH